MNTPEMRRCAQKLTRQECDEILSSATNGVLSLIRPDSAPYGVPLSFAYDRHTDAVYFHCAQQGLKTDCIKENNAASFCVIAQDDIVPDELTTYFKSVIITGKITVVPDREAKIGALDILCKKYTGAPLPAMGINSASECVKRAEILKLSCDFVTGKQAKELIKR